MKVVLNIDSHVSFNAKDMRENDPECIVALEQRFTYSNPEYYKLKAMKSSYGYAYKGLPKKIRSYKRSKTGRIRFSRGCLRDVKKILRDHGHKIRVEDNRLELRPVSFDDKIVLRDEQKAPVDIMIKKQQGIVRGPCSSGKTILLLKAIAMVKQPTTVVVWDTNHQKHWMKEAKEHLALDNDEIGGCGGIFKKPVARKLNLCMQQSLHKPETLAYFADRTGFVAGDECQRYGAKTYEKTINGFPAKFRIGVSADERRKDGKKFLIYDGFGKVIYEMPDKDIGSRREAKVYTIPTGFKSEEFEDSNNHTRLVTEITEDEERNWLIIRAVRRSLAKGKFCLIFTERKTHALWLRQALIDFRVGMVIGTTTNKEIKNSGWPRRWKEFMLGLDTNAEFDRVKKLGEQRKLDVVIGTQKADVGISIRTFDHGFVTTPSSLERFNQQKGRIERDHNEELELKFGSKANPKMYYFWDSKIEKLQKAGNAILKKYPGGGVLKIKKGKGK